MPPFIFYILMSVIAFDIKLKCWHKISTYQNTSKGCAENAYPFLVLILNGSILYGTMSGGAHNVMVVVIIPMFDRVISTTPTNSCDGL